jgi:GDP-4-dehydro-6-deoxy-D-mannose reductase
MTEESPTGGETAYGRTKWAQTTLTLVLAEALGVSASILRPFNVIGPHLGNRLVAGRICEQVVRQAYAQIELGNLSSERDFIDIRDVIQAYHHVYRNGEPGEIYNVCTGVPTRIDLLVRRFKEATGIQKKVVSNAERFRDVDLDRVYGANDKIVSTGWRPTVSLEQSVADMVRAATG